jgi:YegS/Rv2252/BmrU family lipid kinase
MPQSPSDATAFIILNPHAAKGKARTAQGSIERCFSEKGYPFEIVLTEHPLHAIGLARKAVLDGYKLIVAAGGDGTLNEVVDGVLRTSREQELAFHDIPMVGLIPIGRGNDFAYIARTPKNIAQACDLIMEQKWLPTDCGEVFGGIYPKGRYFINGVGLGFEPLVNFVASDFKRISGMLSYLMGLLKVMMRYPKSLYVTFECDNGTSACETQQISVCNGRRMGSMFLMGPEAIIDDGLLDVVYANQEIKRYQILWYAVKFLSGKQIFSPKFSSFRTSRITVEAQGLLACHADGEEISRGCGTISIQLYPASLKFVRI